MDKKIALCIPSRGRRKVLQNFIDSFDVTETGYSEILLRNGYNDVTLKEYLDIDHPKIHHVIGTDTGFDGWPTAGYCFAIQDLVERYPNYDYYGMMEDDCLLLDKGWDQWMISTFEEKFPHGIGLIEFTDITGGIHALFTSKKQIETLGYFLDRRVREQAWESLLHLNGNENTIRGSRIQHCPTPRGQYRNDLGFAGMDPEIVRLWTEDQLLLKQWKESIYPIEKQKLNEVTRQDG